MLEPVAHAVTLSWGWRRVGLVALAGALGALSLAPFHLFAVLWIAFPVLVWALDGAADIGEGRRLSRLGPSFVVGWAFGFGWFLAGLWWIGAAFLVDAAEFGWLLPIAVASLSIGLGLFHGLAAALARLLWSDGSGRIAALAVGFYVADWLRGHVLTGFPWNLIGYGFAADEPMMQIDSVLGGYGLTPLAVLIFAAPALLAGGGRSGRRFVAAMAVLFVGVVGWGAARLHLAPTEFVPDLRFRIVQAAIEQASMWSPEAKADILARYVELSRRPATGPNGESLPTELRAGTGATGGVPGITHLVWPESAFPFVLTNEPWALSTIAELLGDRTTLFTGAVRTEAPAAGEVRHRWYNSIFAIGRDAEILAAYDKAHLVPFGEYLPFQDALEAIGLRQLTKLRGGYSSGPGLRTLTLPGLPPFAPLVCYEIVFPGEVVERSHRPDWMLNVTNDAWYGMTPGPWQHLHQTRLRAVEEGLPVVRAANNGISAVIDPMGRIVADLTLGAVGVVDANLPKPLELTVFSRWGTIPTTIFVVLTLMWALRGRFRRR